jgi:hypothetical protein
MYNHFRNWIFSRSDRKNTTLPCLGQNPHSGNSNVEFAVRLGLYQHQLKLRFPVALVCGISAYFLRNLQILHGMHCNKFEKCKQWQIRLAPSIAIDIILVPLARQRWQVTRVRYRLIPDWLNLPALRGVAEAWKGRVYISLFFVRDRILNSCELQNPTTSTKMGPPETTSGTVEPKSAITLCVYNYSHFPRRDQRVDDWNVTPPPNPKTSGFFNKFTSWRVPKSDSNSSPLPPSKAKESKSKTVEVGDLTTDDTIIAWVCLSVHRIDGCWTIYPV